VIVNKSGNQEKTGRRPDW